MSIEFGTAVRGFLLADTAVAAALPGGIWLNVVPPDVALDDPAAIYTVQRSDRPTSCSGALNHRDVTLSLEFVGVNPTQAQAAHGAIEDRIMAHWNEAITQDGTKVSQLELGEFLEQTEDLSDGSGTTLTRFKTTISGALILS